MRRSVQRSHCSIADADVRGCYHAGSGKRSAQHSTAVISKLTRSGPGRRCRVCSVGLTCDHQRQAMWQGSASITSMITSAMRHGTSVTHIACCNENCRQQSAARCVPVLKYT